MHNSINRLILVIGAGTSLFHLYIGWFGEPHAIFSRSIHLMLMGALTFLMFPLFKERRGITNFIDIILVAILVWSCTYLIINFEGLAWRQGMPTQLEVWMGLLCLVVVVEMARRTMGWSLPILSGFFIIYGIFGPYFGYFSHRPYSLERISSQLFLTTEGIFGLPLGVSASFILLFILFGAFLNLSGAGQFFFDLSYAMAGRRRSGPAQAAIIGSALFGMISGSAVANVSTTGTFTIPLMKKCGFPRISAAAIEAVASTGGQLMPPIMGAAAFVMAELLETPYFNIAKSAALPAFFYFASLAAFVEFSARKSRIRKVELENLPNLWITLRDGLIFIIPVIGLMALLITHHSPAKSAVFSIMLILAVSLIKKDIRQKINVKSVIEALKNGATGTVSTAAACACAGIVIGMVNLTGLGLKMSSGIIALAGGYLPMVLLMVAISCMILGMGMPTTASYVIVAVLGAPALMELGVNPLGAHLFVFYFAVISNITPPVALAAFAGAGIAGSPPMKTGFEAVKFGGLAYVLPFLFVYRPEILLTEGWSLVFWSFICIAFGIYALAIALVGYLHTSLSWLWRFSYLAVALMFFQRIWWINLVGLVFLLIFTWKNKKQ